MRAKSKVTGHFTALATEALRCGFGTFIVDPWVFDSLARPGFTILDEIQAFCWISGCSYRVGKWQIKVIIPERLFWEFQLEELSESIGRMESYAAS